MNRFQISVFFLPLLLWSCASSKFSAIGSIEKLDPALDEIVKGNPLIEIIGEGFEWSEGPLWVESENFLLFSDVPKNIVYKWTAKGGVEPYLSPSGYTGAEQRGGETGSNGLALSADGSLLLAQHGDRRIAKMQGDIAAGKPEFESLADRYNGQRFNSPNDLAVAPNGDIYFTDPPYGLEKQMDDPGKEIPFQGVFRIRPNGEVQLLTDSLSRPNGIIVTADGRSLIVANSDPGKAIWYKFDFTEDGNLVNPQIFYDATREGRNESGSPDGLKSDRAGNIFASGPGGVWIFNKDAQILGKIRLPAPVSNCALTDDEKTLFITADNYLLRVKLR